MVKVAVIGGGAAGFMAAVSAIEKSCGNISIEIFEKDEPLKKILCTGGGRCNITNATFDCKKLASNYPRGEKFLYSVFTRFSVQETIGWFSSHGIELYSQDDGRMFPRSDDANTIRDMFLNRAKKLGINVRSNSPVSKIEHKQDKFLIHVDENIYTFDKIIISTGGKLKDRNSSGYMLAKSLGHRIIELKPALTAFVTNEKWVTALAGVTVKDVEISAIFKNKQVIKDRGDLLFTHRGISGPIILKISSYCAFLDFNEAEPLLLKINFIPDKTTEKLEKELLKIFDKNVKKNLGNILSDYLPKSVVLVILGTENIDPEKKPSQITKTERKQILQSLKALILTVKSPVKGEAMVTAGGVSLDEVNPKTMESKLIKNVYFCGEVLNIDGLTGGFNLQAAWSTGHIAGINAVAE